MTKTPIEELRAIDALRRTQEGQESAKWVRALFDLDDRVKALEASKMEPAQDDEALTIEIEGLIDEYLLNSDSTREVARKIIAAVRAS